MFSKAGQEYRNVCYLVRVKEKMENAVKNPESSDGRVCRERSRSE